MSNEEKAKWKVNPAKGTYIHPNGKTGVQVVSVGKTEATKDLPDNLATINVKYRKIKIRDVMDRSKDEAGEVLSQERDYFTQRVRKFRQWAVGNHGLTLSKPGLVPARLPASPLRKTPAYTQESPMWSP